MQRCVYGIVHPDDHHELKTVLEETLAPPGGSIPPLNNQTRSCCRRSQVSTKARLSREGQEQFQSCLLLPAKMGMRVKLLRCLSPKLTFEGKELWQRLKWDDGTGNDYWFSANSAVVCLVGAANAIAFASSKFSQLSPACPCLLQVRSRSAAVDAEGDAGTWCRTVSFLIRIKCFNGTTTGYLVRRASSFHSNSKIIISPNF